MLPAVAVSAPLYTRDLDNNIIDDVGIFAGMLDGLTSLEELWVSQSYRTFCVCLLGVLWRWSPSGSSDAPPVDTLVCWNLGWLLCTDAVEFGGSWQMNFV